MEKLCGKGRDVFPHLGYTDPMAGRKREAWASERRERRVTVIVVTIPFLIFLVFLAAMTYRLFSSEDLRLENAVERAFSDVLVALQQGDETVPNAMQNRNVLGFGYYTHTGSPIYIWGDAYRVLPFSVFIDQSDLSDTLMSFDRETGRIECMRYAESITFDLDNIFRRGSGIIEMPDIIYLAFDASSFVERRILTRAISICSFAAVIAIYALLLKVIRNNQRIREIMRRQENLVSLGEAARTLAHEIKNPLSAITIELAILKRAVKPELLPDVMIIDQETARLRMLTDRVSDFLRNPVGQPEDIDLIEEIRKLVPLFHGDVRMLVPRFEKAPVHFDREKLRSVMENLMKNAVEACEGRTVDVEIEVADDRSGFYHVFIRDRGCGIREEDRRRVFDPFFTTKINGSGIGLSISSRFLKAAGGSIRLYPRDGGGTTAEVTIAYHGGLRP